MQRLQSRLRNFSICARIAIANAAIIVIGAISGTLVLRRLVAVQASELVFAAAIGLNVAGMLLATYGVTRLALRPLSQLRRAAGIIPADQSLAWQFHPANPDPDTCLLAQSIESIITQLDSSNRRLRALSSRTITVQEEERKRIARWLHDDTGQALIALLLSLQRLESSLPDGETEARHSIAAARQVASDTLAGLRKIIQGLRPAILDDLGLGPAIRWYAHTSLEEAGIQVKTSIPEERLVLPAELAITLFRIAQEMMNNILYHSVAKTASISLQHTASEIYLRIEDDGCGFQYSGSPEEAMRRNHWGLIGIQERVERIGGSFHLTSEPGQGTLVEVCAPCPLATEETHEQDPYPVG